MNQQTETVQTGSPQTQAPRAVTASQILDADKPAQQTETTPQADPNEKVSPKLQMLIQREKAALEAEKKLKSGQTEYESKLKEIEVREAKIKEFEELKKTNPRKALELLGLSYSELTKVELADGEIPLELQIKQLKEELSHYKEQGEAKERQREEEAKIAEERQLSARLDEFKSEISSFLKENNQKYELIAFEQAEDLVYDAIDEHFERTKNPDTGIGEIMSISQAADKVEAYFEKKYDGARSLNKVKTLLAPKQELPLLEKLKAQTQSQKPKTLNNNLSATPAKPRSKVLTDDERIAKAIAYARGLRP